MPTFKQKRDQNHYYENLMQGYPGKRWYINEDMDTPANLKWDCIVLNVCADEGFSYEQARDFLEKHSDELADAYYKALESRLNTFKAAQARDYATFLLNEIVKVHESTDRDFSVFEGDQWPDLSIRVDGGAAVIIEWNDEKVVLRIDLHNVEHHCVDISGRLDSQYVDQSIGNNFVTQSIEDISAVYGIDLDRIEGALRSVAGFFSSGMTDLE